MSTSHAEQKDAQALFVVGPLRAGTTFVRLILGMHPLIHIFGEFEEAVHTLGDHGSPPPSDFARYLETHRAFLAKEISIPNAEADHRGMVLAMWKELVARTDKPIVGASIHSRFDRCPDIWPNAKYVHVLRDPRDVARSCIGMGWVGNSYYGADFWLGAEQRWTRLRERVPASQVHDLRYEELVQEPVRVLTAVCSFLGVEYDPVMLTYPEHTTYGPPQASLAGQWRRKMSGREAQLVESRIGSLLEQRGYERSAPPLGPNAMERLSLLVSHRLGRATFNARRLGPALWAKQRVGRIFPGSDFQRKVQLEINEVHRRHLR